MMPPQLPWHSPSLQVRTVKPRRHPLSYQLLPSHPLQQRLCLLPMFPWVAVVVVTAAMRCMLLYIFLLSHGTVARGNWTETQAYQFGALIRQMLSWRYVQICHHDHKSTKIHSFMWLLIPKVLNHLKSNLTMTIIIVQKEWSCQHMVIRLWRAPVPALLLLFHRGSHHHLLRLQWPQCDHLW